MFGISFAKILVLVAVIAAVWFGFKYLQRLQAEAAARDQVAARRPRPGAAAPREPEPPAAQEMIACRVCGTYVAANTRKSCGRADCLFGR